MILFCCGFKNSRKNSFFENRYIPNEPAKGKQVRGDGKKGTELFVTSL